MCIKILFINHALINFRWMIVKGRGTHRDTIFILFFFSKKSQEIRNPLNIQLTRFQNIFPRLNYGKKLINGLINS